MGALVSITVVVALLLVAAVVFLAREHLKKFNFMRQFVRHSHQSLAWEYPGAASGAMRNVALRGQQPFAVLIGFHLNISWLGYRGFDYYGYVESDKNNIAVFATYLGKNPCRFQFLTTTDVRRNPLIISSTEDDQQLTPQATYMPHWFQRLGFFG